MRKQPLRVLEGNLPSERRWINDTNYGPADVHTTTAMIHCYDQTAFAVFAAKYIDTPYCTADDVVHIYSGLTNKLLVVELLRRRTSGRARQIVRKGVVP